MKHQRLRDVVEQHIRRTLASVDGNVSAAARALGINRRTLQRWLANRRG